MRYEPQAALSDIMAERAEASGLTGAVRRRSAPRDGAGPHVAAERMVVGQLGQSLDGRIATPTGKSKYISGRSALAHLHRLRAAVDAVLVGVGTVIADDPLLTVRLVAGRSPVRVIVDPSGRMPKTLRCLGCEAAPTLVVRAHDAECEDDPSYEVIRLERGPNGEIPPKAIFDALAERGLARVLLEGGATTLSRAIAAGCVDVLHVTVSPMILGSGRPGLALPPIDELTEAVRPSAQIFTFEDGDTLFACDLRRRAAKSAPPLSLVGAGAPASA